jgi:hypothetical protein
LPIPGIGRRRRWQSWTRPAIARFPIRGNSLDSRDPRIGLVSRDEITRHAGLIYWSADWHRIGTPIE